ncbi:putative inorganic phosphate cotransporter [Phymastichus coffea]|uniref:putative inorganic phosphate cotransporter n=1 Tax=Phymastichus coffea TaxID=108790 RepID=UPI00273CB0BC|nr:putative inorganic phosphate cotransporter [Phymastichus coffea]XP_058808283.1 putative inorganic phosphate cotransporter [Phymastichus coffea]XP_058808284.1 putative inorganic phosphate cotransporter [Phymastichus coffea]XP_058808285.1 putative inorganic phosphate cotransporter [Phymastichus coffea]
MNSLLKPCCVHFRQRWVFALMCFLGLFHAYAMRACLSITLTEMVITSEPDVAYDDSCPFNVIENVTVTDASARSREIYSWNEETQGLILSSFYWGYVVTHLPGGLISEKYGGKHTYGLGIFLTAVFTLVTPLSVLWAESTGLIVVRVLMGLGEGVTYPAISFLLAQWIPPDEISRTGTFVYAGQLLGTIYANSISGMILQHTGNWQSVFYIIGGVSAVWYIFWLILCYNNPREHPFISESELNYLNEQLSHTNEKSPPIPWRHVLKSKPMWATVIGMIGFNWSILTIVTDLPKYMSSVLKFSVEHNGYLNSLVYLSMWIGSMIISWLADFMISNKCLSTTNVRKAGSVVALTCSACFVIAGSYAGCDQVLVIVMFTVAMGLMGAAYPSIMVNTLDISPNYSGTLMALSNGISAGFTGILSPYIIGVMTPNQTLGEWRFVFWILFVVSIITNTVYLLIGKGKVEYWNDPNFNTTDISKPTKADESSNICNTVV